MKRATNLFLLLILTSTSIFPAFAQRTRANRPIKDTQPSIQETEFGQIGGVSDGTGAWLTWQMNREVNNLGFRVYKLNGKERELVPGGDFIKGSETLYGSDPVSGERYDLFDQTGTLEDQYVVVGLQKDGTTVESTPFYPQYVSDMRSLSGFTSRTPKRSSNGLLEHRDMIIDDEDLKAEIAANQLVPDPTTHLAVISTPGSVKIGVRADGIYRVTRTELQNAGFNVNIDPSTWQLYTEGNEQAITIGPNADYIEFIGKAIDTLESDMRMYYLIPGNGLGKRIGTKVARPLFSTVISPSTPQTLTKKERVFYLAQILNGSANNYFGTFVGTSPTNITFNLTGIDFNSPTTAITLKLQAYTKTLHNVSVTLNGQPLASMQGGGPNQRPPALSADYVVPTSILVEGTNTFQLKETVTGASSFFDSVSTSYARKYSAIQNQLTFVAPNYRNVNLDGFSSANIRMFDVTNENEPVLVTNLNPHVTGPSFGVTLPSGKAHVYYAAEDSSIRQAAFVGANDPALLTGPSAGAQFIVITDPSLTTQANSWAAYRAAQGTTTRVVDVNEIFDEFNYGVSSANSIKSFLQYAQTNWLPAPQYVLLFGDGSYDPRNYEGGGYFNAVPTKMVDTVYLETPSDEALADFDNDGLAELSIGRVPARTADYAATMFQKTQQWELNNNTSRGALFAYDDNNGWPFDAMSQLFADQLPAGMPRTMAPRSIPNPTDARTFLLAQLNTDKYVVNYSGHGTTGLWAATSFFSSLDVPGLTPTANPTIYTMLTCLNGYFANPSPSSDSLSEVLTKTPGKGAVVTWSSSGETTPDVQQQMATRFFQDIGTLPASARLGDLIKNAKTQVEGGTDVRLSWVLLGDPMLKMHPDPAPPVAFTKGR